MQGEDSAAGQSLHSPGAYGAPPVPPPPPSARPPPPRTAPPPPPPPPSESHVRRPSYQQPIVASMQEADGMTDGEPPRPSYEAWGVDQPAPPTTTEELAYGVPPIAPPAPPLPPQVCWQISTGPSSFSKDMLALLNPGRLRLHIRWGADPPPVMSASYDALFRCLLLPCFASCR